MRKTLTILFLLAGVLVFYARSLPDGFVYDDHWVIERNPAVRSLDLGRLFSDRDAAALPQSGMGHSIYRPLPTLSFALDARLGGLDPARMRLEDLLLHAGNGLLLILFLTRRLKLSGLAGLFAGMVFLFHPAQVETAVWLSNRANLLCLSSFWAALWLLTAEPGNWIKDALGVAAFAVSLLFKETGLVLLPLLGVWDFCRLPAGRSRGRWKAYLFLALTTEFYLAWRYSVLGELSQREVRGSILRNWLTGALAWWDYLKLLLWPAHLTASHGQPSGHPANLVQTWLGVESLLAVLAAGLFLCRKRPVAGLLLLWIPICLLLNLNIVPSYTFVSEHYLYFSLCGLAGLAGWTWDQVNRPVGRVALGAWLVFLLYQGWTYQPAWKDDVSLWRAAVRQEPANAFAHASLGDALATAGRWEEAGEECRSALSLGATRQVALASAECIARSANRLGHPAEALSWAERILAVQAGFAPALHEKALALERLGRKKEAEAAMREAGSSDPAASDGL
jgi:tetratricopeptide (TPR) repeat protein